MSRLGLTMADFDSIKSNGSCLWSEDEDGNWHTSCRQIHIFFEDGPVENFYKYCPYCGKFLAVNIKEEQS